jgi:hypothetical protein
VAAHGDYVYAASGGNYEELRIIDVTDAEHPRKVGEAGPPQGENNSIADLAVNEHHLFVYHEYGSLDCYEIIDAAHPQWLSTAPPREPVLCLTCEPAGSRIVPLARAWER